MKKGWNGESYRHELAGKGVKTKNTKTNLKKEKILDNDKNLICVKCGMTQEKRNTMPPMKTGINHPIYKYTKSFYLTWNEKTHTHDIPMCPECHKEKGLQNCMDAMDNYEKKHGKKALENLFFKK